MERRESVYRKEVWFNDVDDRLKPTDYPLERSVAEVRLRDASIEGESASGYFDRMEWPMTSREDLMDKLRMARERGAVVESVAAPLERHVEVEREESPAMATAHKLAGETEKRVEVARPEAPLDREVEIERSESDAMIRARELAGVPEPSVYMEREPVQMEKVIWFSDIDSRIRPTDYPLERRVAEERLREAYIDGERPSLYYDRIEWPVTSRQDFINKLQMAREKKI